jgi:hypothetical protein
VCGVNDGASSPSVTLEGPMGLGRTNNTVVVGEMADATECAASPGNEGRSVGRH